MPCRSSRHSVICSGNYPASILQREFKEWVIIRKHTSPLISTPFHTLESVFQKCSKSTRQLLPVQEDFVQRCSQSIRHREFLVGEIPEVIQASSLQQCSPLSDMSTTTNPQLLIFSYLFATLHIKVHNAQFV